MDLQMTFIRESAPADTSVATKQAGSSAKSASSSFQSLITHQTGEIAQTAKQTTRLTARSGQTESTIPLS
jgi:hypothetical protein